MWSQEFVATSTGSPAQGSKFTSANPPVHDLLSLLVLEEYGLDVLNIAPGDLAYVCKD